MCHSTRGIQRTTCRRNQFSTSSMCVLGIELRLSLVDDKCLYLLGHFSGPCYPLSYYNLLSSSSSIAPLLFSCLFFLYDHMSLTGIVYRCWTPYQGLPPKTSSLLPPAETISCIVHLLPDIDRSNFVQVITTVVSSRLQQSVMPRSQHSTPPPHLFLQLFHSLCSTFSGIL